MKKFLSTVISTLNQLRSVSFILFIVSLSINDYAISSVLPLCQNLTQKALFSIVFFLLWAAFLWVGFRILSTLSIWPQYPIQIIRFLSASTVVFLIGIFYSIIIVAITHIPFINFAKNNNFVLHSIVFFSISFATYFHGHKLPDIAAGRVNTLKGSINAAKSIVYPILFTALCMGIFSAIEYSTKNISIFNIFYSTTVSIIDIIISWILRKVTLELSTENVSYTETTKHDQ
jgi:hypothetical protein